MITSFQFRIFQIFYFFHICYIFQIFYVTMLDSSLLPQANIARHCRMTKAIKGKACEIPEGTIIGENRADDEKRFYFSPVGVAWYKLCLTGLLKNYTMCVNLF